MLTFTPKGIYCPQADIYIDPWRAVPKALITHGHADHSRKGHQSYLFTETAAPAIRYRLGNINYQTTKFGETTTINGVKISFHPAGHILGSAQIRLEYKGEIWVASGDYKLEDDGLAEAFEPVKCNTFITESTFGLPIYNWKPQAEIFQEINDWWRQNQADGKVSFLTGYSLGKAQRILKGLDASIGKIFTHSAVENINKVFRKQGIQLPETIRATEHTQAKSLIGNLVLAPPSTLNSNWMRKMKPISIAICSGWMALRGARRRRNVDRGFILSDHADWAGLNQAVKATEAERVIVTHGSTDVYAKYLQEQGLQAEVATTEFTGETLDPTIQDNNNTAN